MREDFCVFIITHGRPNRVQTYALIRRQGYTGRIILLMDTDDSTYPEYCKLYPESDIIRFSKAEEAEHLDECDNFRKRMSTVYARNASFRIAKDLGYKYFVQLDDDYHWFGIRNPLDISTPITNLDRTFSYVLEFLEQSPPSVFSVAFSQGGDHIGGYDPNKPITRKAMNSFFCRTDRPFSFVGRLNEDVNTYVHHGKLGAVFLTIPRLQLNQAQTQSRAGGMTSAYMEGGTYVKSFYTVVVNPAACKVKTIGVRNKRIHHAIDWETAVPKILPETFRKPRSKAL